MMLYCITNNIVSGTRVTDIRHGCTKERSDTHALYAYKSPPGEYGNSM